MSRWGTLVAAKIVPVLNRAHRRDLARAARAERTGRPPRAGATTHGWALAKSAILALTAPGWLPAALVAASVQHRATRRDVHRFPPVVRSIAEHRPLPAGIGGVIRRPASERIVVFSDLHRCIDGRLDWPQRQGTKALYADVLAEYARDDWTLCENGDVEDFWMVGGSTLGSAYDALRLVAAATARSDDTALDLLYRRYLELILDNNAEIYDVIATGFARDGRYLRTIGNHDDPLHRPSVQAVLRSRIGEVPIGDFVALDRGDDLVALIAHGHHTDGWNATGHDALGKLSTWLGGTIVDTPGVNIPEGLPSSDERERLREEGPRDLLIRLHPLIGATTDYDSLDEELLFDAMRRADLLDVWLMLGHTHVPMSAPASRLGSRWTHYVNGGSGITNGFITGIEWDGSAPDPAPRLVSWTRTASGELHRDEPRVRTVSSRE